MRQRDRQGWMVRAAALALASVVGAGQLGAAGVFAAAQAADAYFDEPLAELRFESGEGPTLESLSVAFHQPWRPYDARVVLEGEGEAWLVYSTSERRPEMLAGDVRLAVRAPQGLGLRGTIWLPNAETSALVPHRFTLGAECADPAARIAWLTGRYQHYAQLFARGLPGAAWFRHMKQVAERELVEAGGVVPPDLWSGPTTDWRRPDDLEDSFELFTGGRALSENLQLERALEPANREGEWVAIETLAGITVQEFDWAELTKDLEPELDPLTRFVPADQHAVFFPSVSALVELVDEALAHGAPVLALLEPRAEDARTLARYERQLCVSLDELARAFGDALAKSVVVTGSDPYLRTGTDLALVFEPRQAELLLGVLRARQEEAAGREGAKLVELELAGMTTYGVESADRRVSSYAARVGDAVVLTNSRHQLERIARTHSGEMAALAALDEYTFFRARYPRAESESALLVISDATIRRWCGPKWRIGASRRTRAAAVMLEEQCANLAELASGDVSPRELRSELAVPGGGALRLTPAGVVSDVYGTPDFLTPIAELDIARVAPDEARQYERYRELYQRQWRRFFDPIAARIEIEAERIALDLTVMPLIFETDYAEMVDLSRGMALDPRAGDPHPESILHFVLALNRESETFRQMREFLSVLDSRIGSGLDWVGDSVALWLDRDPVWAELDTHENPEDFFEDHLSELPFAARVDSRSPLKLAAFLTALRAFVDGTVPDLLSWETRQRGEHSYVVIHTSMAELGAAGAEDLAIYYVALPDGLLVCPNEAVVQRAIDRHAARAAGAEPAPVRPWLGENMALRIEHEAIRILLAVSGEPWREDLQRTAWAALPILDEWKRLFPDQDPLAFHARFFTVLPTDPGGGAYRWNAELGAMESSVFGSALAPRMDMLMPPALDRLRHFDAGLSFEHDGLRARVELGRSPN